jgi:hypothetical protein
MRLALTNIALTNTIFPLSAKLLANQGITSFSIKKVLATPVCNVHNVMFARLAIYVQVVLVYFTV